MIVAEGLAATVAAETVGRRVEDRVARMKGEVFDRIRFRHPLYERDSLGVLGGLRDARCRHGRRPYGAGPRRRRLPHGHEVRPGHLRADRARRTLPRHGRTLRRPARVRREPEGRRGAEGARAPLASTSRFRTPIRTAGAATTRSSSWPRRSGSSAMDDAEDCGRGCGRRARCARRRSTRWTTRCAGSRRWGHDRIYNMVANRPDWCMSRQRAWGVPIPALDCTQCGEAIIIDGDRREGGGGVRALRRRRRGTSVRRRSSYPQGSPARRAAAPASSAR